MGNVIDFRIEGKFDSKAAIIMALSFTVLNGMPIQAVNNQEASQPTIVAVTAPDAVMITPNAGKIRDRPDSFVLDSDSGKPLKDQSENKTRENSQTLEQIIPKAEMRRELDTSIVGKPFGFHSKIPAMVWVDETIRPKAALLCIHGLSLHKGTYDAFAKRMAKDGFAVFAIDVRGFGDWLDEGELPRIDLQGSLIDIKEVLLSIHNTYPNLPVVILGESMGGAISLHATALYPDLIAGLVSSVPAGDRFGQTDEDFKVGIHALLGGFNKEMNVGSDVVAQATKKEELRKAWSNDPLVRMKLSPHELLQFQKFMDKNFESAKVIKDTPVLFIQGTNDKLVRPAGTWKLCDALSTPTRQIVFSKTGEHLILEEGQFSEQDIGFVEKWLNDHVLSKGEGSRLEASAPRESTTMSNRSLGSSERSRQDANVSGERPTNSDRSLGLSERSPQDAGAPKETTACSISYWIELYRNGKTYRCNNRYAFRTGDAIRFHMISEKDGYAYVVMEEGTSGKQAVLFPDPQTGTANDIACGQDYPLPSKAWLKFDNTPGIEKISLIYSPSAIDNLMMPKTQKYLTAFISSDRSGSKDLVPARMELSWEDPDPIIIPQSITAQKDAPENKLDNSAATVYGDKIGSSLGKAKSANNSMVKISLPDLPGVISIDIALAHN